MRCFGARVDNAGHARRRLHLITLGVGLTAAMLMTFPASSAQAKGKRSGSRTVSFEDDVVETAYLRPESSVVESINSRTRTSLIRIRMDFLKEIIRSATKL